MTGSGAPAPAPDATAGVGGARTDACPADLADPADLVGPADLVDAAPGAGEAARLGSIALPALESEPGGGAASSPNPNGPGTFPLPASVILAAASPPVGHQLTRMRALLRKGYRGTLADTFKGRENGVGFLRFCLAMSVVVSHTRVLGFGGPDLLGGTFRNQQALGGLAVAGFFVLSGMLITRSARRTNFFRYAWHRCLRIFPGLWVCLAVTAFVVAPLLAVRQNGSLQGFWNGASRPGGPVHYVSANMWSGVQQYGIRDLLVQSTPWAG